MSVSGKLVVIDTNVVVSGLLAAHAASPVVRILDGMLAAVFPFALSEALLAEYRDVLARPHLRKLHGLGDAELETVLAHVVANATILQPVAAPSAPDPGDQHLWELLACRADVLLVTGDGRLFDSEFATRLIRPGEFMRQMA